MGPENPPRRTGSDDEPLTIDLEANRTAPDEADAVVDRDQVTDDAADIRADEPQDATAPVSEDAAEDARAEAAAAAFAEEPAPASGPADTTYHHPPTAPHKPSSAGALAAGILGGLITLLGFGGLQYAGVVPALSPDNDRAAFEQGVAGEIEAIKSQLAAAPAPAPAADLAPLETRLAALEKTVSETPESVPADISGLEAQLTNLTNELAALKSDLAESRQTTEEARSALSTRIEAAEKKIDEPASDVQLARAIAVTALKTAIDRGGPFLAELDALKSVSADDPAVTGLASDATTGVVSRADLARDFPETANAMLDATRHSGPDQGVFARLIDSASSAIRVRPVGSVEGEGPEGIVLMKTRTRSRTPSSKGSKASSLASSVNGNVSVSSFKA